MTTASENQSVRPHKTLTREQKLASILRAFETSHPAKQYEGYRPGTGLRGIIERSPALKIHLLQAVDAGDISKIEALIDGNDAAVTYSNITKTLTVNANHLAYTDRLADLSMAVDHAVGHALDESHRNQRCEFEADMTRTAAHRLRSA